MAKFTSTKTALAVAAGLLGLGLSAPAMASSITFQFDYATESEGVISSVVTSLVTGDLDTLSADQVSGKTAYLMTTIIGTRTMSNGNAYTLSSLAPSAGGVQYDGSFFYDNIIYVDNTTHQASIDNFGIAYWGSYLKNTPGGITTVWNEFDVCYENGQASCFIETGLTPDYYEIVDSGDHTTADLDITQVPEPSVLVLLGGSLLGMGLLRRRRDA